MRGASPRALTASSGSGVCMKVEEDDDAELDSGKDFDWPDDEIGDHFRALAFILDFIFGAIPLYVGRNREKPGGYIACDIKKQYAVFDAKVVSSIRKGPVKGRKKA